MTRPDVGRLIAEAALAGTLDLHMLQICLWLGRCRGEGYGDHLLEGQVVRCSDGHLRVAGRCSRCGVAAVLDG